MSSLDKINELREEIDKIDKNLMDSFKKRIEICKEIGELKSKNNIDILDKSREEKLLENLYNYSDTISFGDQIDKDFIKEIWNSIMKFSRMKQFNVHMK